MKRLVLLTLLGACGWIFWPRSPEPTPSVKTLIVPVENVSATTAPTAVEREEKAIPYAPPSPPPSPVDKTTDVTPEEVSPVRRVARLRKALLDDPENPELLAALGLALSREMRSPEEGIPYLEKSLSIDPSNGSAFYDLVGSYLEAGDAARGVAYLEGLLARKTPNEAAIYAALADLKATTGDLSGGIEAAQNAQAKEPDSAVINSLLGSIYLEQSDPRAEEAFQRTEQIESNQIEAMRSRGLSTEAQEKNRLETRVGLVESLLLNGKSREAEQVLSSIPDSDPKRFLENRLRELEEGG